MPSRRETEKHVKKKKIDGETGKEIEVEIIEDIFGYGNDNEVMAEALKNSFRKALQPLSDIRNVVEDVRGISRVRYGEEDYKRADQIFVLDLEVLLNRDVRLDMEITEKYRMWVNTAIHQLVYLFPNSTRVVAISPAHLQYVSDIIESAEILNPTAPIAITKVNVTIIRNNLHLIF